MSLSAVRKGVLNFCVLKKGRRPGQEKVNLASTTATAHEPPESEKTLNPPLQVPCVGLLTWLGVDV